jgi:hypothetical protein
MEKHKLQLLNLTPKEYEEAIIRMAKRLKV